MSPTRLSGMSRTACLGPLLNDACAAITPFSLMASAPMSRHPAAPESRVFRSIIVAPLYRNAVMSVPIWATPTTCVDALIAYATLNHSGCAGSIVPRSCVGSK